MGTPPRLVSRRDWLGLHAKALALPAVLFLAGCGEDKNNPPIDEKVGDTRRGRMDAIKNKTMLKTVPKK